MNLGFAGFSGNLKQMAKKKYGAGNGATEAGFRGKPPNVSIYLNFDFLFPFKMSVVF